VTKRFPKRLSPFDDLSQGAVKIEIFRPGSTAGIATNFIFASPRGRKVTSLCGANVSAREEALKILQEMPRDSQARYEAESHRSPARQRPI
jgi:hypothetical protein